MCYHIYVMEKKRIEWIDIAKGIAIILMVAAHSMKWRLPIRNYIFSFHMPIFLSLSGYSIKLSIDKNEIIKNIKKDFKHLIGNYLLFALVAIILEFIFSKEHNLEVINKLLTHQSLALLWGSGIEVYEYPTIGMIWFLLSLFTAKLIIYLCHYFFHDNKFETISYFIFPTIGILLAIYPIYLPLNLDVSFVCVFFVYIGMLYKKYENYLDEHNILLILFAFIIQFALLGSNYIFDISGRTYTGLTISFICAICGEYLLICLSKALCETKYIKKFLSLLGIESLMVLFVHYQDFIIMRYISFGPGFKRSLIGLLIVIPISLLFIYIKRLIKKKV